jgi:RNA polymerase sigma factor (sigma-70 family)
VKPLDVGRIAQSLLTSFHCLRLAEGQPILSGVRNDLTHVDESEQAESVRDQYEQIYRYVRRRSRTVEDAEDVTQQVFADAAAALEPGKAQPRVLGWLYRVAQRRLADEARRGIRAHELKGKVLDVAPTPASAYGRAVARAIGGAIANLPQSQRQVVVMRLLEGRSFGAIAGRLGVTEAAAKMRFVRGLEALRESLRREGIEP